MHSITSGHDATLFQLQYLTDSLGLRRNYLEADDYTQGKNASNSIATHLTPDDLKNLAKPYSHTRVARCLVHLSAANIIEIKAALAHFKGLEDDNGPDSVSRDTFPLPTLSCKLFNVAQNVHWGTGFIVIRGLDPRDFSPLDNVLIYLGITSHIAEIRGCQDFDGRMIVHIKDIEQELPDASGRPSPYTNQAQPFHTDMCDILSMYVLDTAEEGGESFLSSGAMIYNELAATRPDIIHALADNKLIHEDFEGHGPGFCYSRRPLTGAPFSPHRPDVPAMTEEQAEAIDTVHFTAVKHQLIIKLKPGDIEVFNHMALFHARNGSKIGSRTLAPRHALLADDNLAWKTPEALLHNHNQIYGNSEARKIGRWDVQHNLEEIAAVDGIDVLFIGPFDLGNSIGYPILNGSVKPELKASINRILETSRKAGKKCGIYSASGEQAKGYIEAGFDMVHVGTDYMMLQQATRAEMGTAQGKDLAKRVGY
ncbi:hypothetical protein FANTH_8011 [Fusarium anthophilum]|uniref:TauD/TfdA-like domain-containing protein n=1 Tax=Fusarium anthophilum TaxID=48485 RepID=A0A8H5E207_9HYPO|nr:hypothetical protein FANTH_8011 [Fusarium anthophilum]